MPALMSEATPVPLTLYWLIDNTRNAQFADGE